MLINPDIEAWFEKLQGRRLGAGGSAPRGQGLPNYGSSALQGIVKPGAGMFGFTAPPIRSNYRPTPIAPNPAERAPSGIPAPFEGISGGGRDLGGGAKAAGLQKLGSGIEQAMKSLAEKRAAAQRAQAIVDPLSAMKGNPGATMPPGTNNGPLGEQAARNPGATMPAITAATPYTPSPVGAVSETPLAAQSESQGVQPIPPIGSSPGSLPTFASGPGGMQMAGGPLPGIDFNHYRDITAGIESGHGTVPDRPGSQYHGTYQLGPGWGGQGDEETRFLRGTTDNYKTLSNALGRTPTETELYLAHQQGPDAAVKLSQNPGKTPADLGISSRNITSNRGDPNAPSQAFIDKWAPRYGAGLPQAPTTGAAAYAAMPPSITDNSTRALAAGPAAPSSQGVVPGQSDPHQPGFDPNSVPFHRTPEMDQGAGIPGPGGALPAPVPIPGNGINPIGYSPAAGEGENVHIPSWQDLANNSPRPGGYGTSPLASTSFQTTPRIGEGMPTPGGEPDPFGDSVSPGNNPGGNTPRPIAQIPDRPPQVGGYMPIPTAGDAKFQPIGNGQSAPPPNVQPPLPQQPAVPVVQTSPSPQDQLAAALAQGGGGIGGMGNSPSIDPSMLAMALYGGGDQGMMAPDVMPVDIAPAPSFADFSAPSFDFGGMFG